MPGPPFLYRTAGKAERRSVFPAALIFRTILYHDGYVGLNDESGRAKRQRNQALLEARLKEDPDNVRVLLQYIESSRPDPQHLDYIRRGLAVVESKKKEWETFGPVIYRYAVLAARGHHLPEEEEWTARGLELFPDSFYSRIDIAFLAFIRCWENKRYKECIPWGEMYMSAIEDYDAGRGDRVALRISTLLGASHQWRQRMFASMALACREEGQPGRAVELMDAFLQTAPLAFGPDVREQEENREDFHRHSYTLYLPLAGQCEVGTAAAVMEAEGVQELDRLLGMVKNWGGFSVSALIHALEHGAAFPPVRRKVASAALGQDRRPFRCTGLRLERPAVGHGPGGGVWESNGGLCVPLLHAGGAL